MWNKDEREKIFKWIDGARPQMVELQKQLSAIPAIGPKGGGEGEAKKAAFIAGKLKEWGFSDVEEIRAPADDVPSGYRPSVVARVPGKSSERTVWVMSHLDIVPPGARELWKTDPYEVVEKDGKLFGRGVEDNQQGMVASIFASRALMELKIKPAHDVALLLIADEETGSDYGIRYLLKEKNVFRRQDIIMVPDGGIPEGNKIQIAEKSICWLKFTVIGAQTHAARPDMGNNAHRAACAMVLHVDKVLHERYRDRDPVFEPPDCTFEPTKREANVENVNTVPGADTFYFDCRILPPHELDDMLKLVGQVANAVADEYGVKVKVEPAMKQQCAPATPVTADVVKRLGAAIKDVYGSDSKPFGVGGGTVAAFLRKAGYEAAVWAKIDEVAHQPNEYCHIANLIGDAKVFAHVFGQK
ncbi:MAG: M20 family metallo-hydrolase [Planctomycetota bacterium]|jgi:succinyl-diaminopimelate desuccinylase